MQICYSMYLNSTGYSIAAQEYIFSLIHVKPDIAIKVKFFNKLTSTGVSKNKIQLFQSMHKTADKSSQTDIYHCIPHRYQKTQRKSIGIALFETINPPDHWISLMNNMDEIITASEFNKNIFISGGLKKPIHVIPHTFNSDMFNDSVQPNGRYRPFTFFSMGTWKQRKNWDTLIKGFYDAFEDKDDVCLYLKTDKPDQLEKHIKDVKSNSEWRSKNTAPIYFDKNLHQDFEIIPSIMKKGDVFITTSLGEGFGYCGFHAMALKIPLITTKFGGCLQYAKSEFCTYLEPSQYKTYPTMDRIPQYANCIWPVLRISEVRDKLIYVKNNYNEAKEKANKAYDFVHKNFNYNVIGNSLLSVLEAK